MKMGKIARQKTIISDRCELNRQIKADNALLRELKVEIKKLAALVAHTVPAVAERLERLRSRILIFCYQLSHISADVYKRQPKGRVNRILKHDVIYKGWITPPKITS